jgi:hypothetical protein
MPKEICEISASSWFYYKEICYDAWSHEHKKKYITFFPSKYIKSEAWLILWW